MSDKIEEFWILEAGTEITLQEVKIPLSQETKVAIVGYQPNYHRYVAQLPNGTAFALPSNTLLRHGSPA